jgi:carbon-monoxide dehydrogenase medium subunit
VKNFEFYEPVTLAEASRLFAQEHAQLLAGGTDLVIGMKAYTKTPQSVISLQKIPGLSSITTDADNGITIGAMTKAREVELSDDIQKHHTALAEGAAEIGSIQIRNLATIGGNIAHASPAADTVAGLLVADAQVDIAGADGERTVPINELFTGPGQTVLKQGEIITQFRLSSPASGSHYIKHKIREVMDLAFIGVASAVNLENGTIIDVRIGLAAVAPTPIRATEAENLLKGKIPTPELLQQAGEAAAAGASPISDLRCSAEHRREMVDVLTRRTLQHAIGRAS